MNKNLIIGGIAVVVIGVLAFVFMGGDTPQSLIDETVELMEECLPVAFTGDADAIADCDERGKDLEKRLDAVFADMSDEEKAEWEKKAEAAFTKAFGE